MQSKNRERLKIIAAMKESKSGKIRIVAGTPKAKMYVVVKQGSPKRSGVDATERVNRRYNQLLKQG